MNCILYVVFLSLELGAAISETHTIFSLEENFLSVVDFGNDTESGEIEVDIAWPGRERFVVECNCTSSSSCESIDVTVTYADVHFQLNESPKVEALMVSPETGSALETIFQIRSRAKDSDRPLRYSLYCAIGPDVTLLLGLYLDYDMVETFLPYIERWSVGTSIFTRALFESLPASHSGCWLPQYRYAAILDQLAAAGLDITPLLS